MCVSAYIDYYISYVSVCGRIILSHARRMSELYCTILQLLLKKHFVSAKYESNNPLDCLSNLN